MERIQITGTGSELQGVGRLSDGRAVFVPGALPGEAVEIEVTRDGGRFCEARLLRVLEASPDRRDPDCPHYGRCGGCSARHMTYGCSLRLKRQRVVDALERIGGVGEPNVLPTLGSDATQRCRNKAEYAVSLREGRLSIGSFEGKSRRVLPLEDCLLQSEESVRALRWMHAHLAEYPLAGHIRFLVTRVNRAGEMMLTLSGDAPVQGGMRPLATALMAALPEVVSVYFCRLAQRPAHALDGTCSWIAGRRTLEDELLGLRFELAPQAFFQVNPLQAEKLYLKALEAAGLTEGAPKRVLDAYCGAGTITLAAARLAETALGVEIVPPAIENAKQNARRNGLEDRARFICGDAAREIPRRIAAGECFDAAILDPPRKGADAALLNAIADAGIARIAYVSCNPSTLARDVKLLVERSYRLEWAQPVDMFPWTEHVETVVLMSRVEE